MSKPERLGAQQRNTREISPRFSLPSETKFPRGLADRRQRRLPARLHIGLSASSLATKSNPHLLRVKHPTGRATKESSPVRTGSLNRCAVSMISCAFEQIYHLRARIDARYIERLVERKIRG